MNIRFKPLPKLIKTISSTKLFLYFSAWLCLENGVVWRVSGGECHTLFLFIGIPVGDPENHKPQECVCLYREGGGRMTVEEDAIIFLCYPATTSSLLSPLHFLTAQQVKNKPLLNIHKGTWKGLS